MALAVCALAILTAATGIAVFEHYYFKYSRWLDQKLASDPFANTANIYSAARMIAPGQEIGRDEIVAWLRAAGYGASPSGNAGWYRAKERILEIHPASPGYPPATLTFDKKGERLARIAVSGGQAAETYRLEPRLMANISARNREKRKLVRFREVPEHLVQAILAAEDRRFFEHGGLDSARMVKAAYVDLKTGSKGQGASTLTMQLARNLWLQPDKTWSRKLTESMIALQLEQRLSKEEIFEYYLNEVYLGRRGTFNIHGFGEAAWQYFGKDTRRLSLAEAATLAGLPQRPSYFDPLRRPERARQRRDLVLALMRKNGYIEDKQYAGAVAAPLGLNPAGLDSQPAPYFLDLVNAELAAPGRGARSVRNVYTTLDLDLQRVAEEAVRAAMPKLDSRLKDQHGDVLPQVALIAIDPSTGDIKALIGGRNYQTSQLNRALARRPPGSIFKPFVYAAAFETALRGGPGVFTAASLVSDEPTTFLYKDDLYDPGNYGGAFYGELTLRDALAKSVNVATVKVARDVGYGNIVRIARAAGLSPSATPSMALGAYDVTPLEMTGAYTVFANAGVYLPPRSIAEIRSADGRAAEAMAPKGRPVLDSRVAFLAVSLMEEVMRSGTGASVYSLGVNVPVAGKTGTTRDGWFAGFTTNLLCLVWVGFDDYRDLKMEGARSALPVWAEFMRRAVRLPAYRKTGSFRQPPGITGASIDPLTGMLAGENCIDARWEYFIAGTEPREYCPLHSGQKAVQVTASGW